MNTFDPLFINRVADGALTKYRIVAAGDDDGVVTQSALSTDKLVGVVGSTSVEDGERVDIAYGGIVPVEYGDDVEQGDLLTSDSVGRAVPAQVGDRVIGVAFEEGDSGTIGSLVLKQSGTVGDARSGSFDPTVTAGTNVASVTAAKGIYHRVGDYVFGHVRVTGTHTAGAPTASDFECALPVASDFSAAEDAIGTVTGQSVTLGRLTASLANNRLVAAYSIGTTGSTDITLGFSYRVR